MKRWYYLALAAAAAASAVYVYSHWNSLGNLPFLAAKSAGDGAAPTHMEWQTVERPNEGIKVQLPAEPRDLQVPAYNETGGSEPVKMMIANPDANTTFAVCWQDNPPVARVSRTADRTLSMARDGMLARTQTAIVGQTIGLVGGNPSLDVSARNREGGILEARLIYTGNRLYVLMAMFPSESARRGRDVTRFFDSFAHSGPPGIPQTMPSAAQN